MRISRTLALSICALAVCAAAPATAAANYSLKINDPITQQAHYRGQTPKVSIAFTALDSTERYAQVYLTNDPNDRCDASWGDVAPAGRPHQLTLGQSRYPLYFGKLAKVGKYRMCVTTFETQERGIEPTFTYQATTLAVTKKCTAKMKARKKAKRRGGRAYAKSTKAAKRAC